MTVSEQIIQVINALCEKVGIGIDWTSENVLPCLETLCGKLIRYELWTSILWIVFAVLMSVASVITIKKVYPFFKKKMKDDSWGDWGFGLFLTIIGVICINIVSIIIMLCQVADIIQCVTFPEMYIFDYVSVLMKRR